MGLLIADVFIWQDAGAALRYTLSRPMGLLIADVFIWQDAGAALRYTLSRPMGLSTAEVFISFSYVKHSCSSLYQDDYI
jgi:hypothetical protein